MMNGRIVEEAIGDAAAADEVQTWGWFADIVWLMVIGFLVWLVIAVWV